MSTRHESVETAPAVGSEARERCETLLRRRLRYRDTAHDEDLADTDEEAAAIFEVGTMAEYEFLTRLLAALRGPHGEEDLARSRMLEELPYACPLCGARYAQLSDAEECCDDEPLFCTCRACSCMSRNDLDAGGVCEDCRRGVHEEVDVW